MLLYRVLTGRLPWDVDTRTQLLRAHLMRGLLADRGVQVEILTTSDDGAAFLAALGTPAAVLSRWYRVEFDARQSTRRRVP